MRVKLQEMQVQSLDKIVSIADSWADATNFLTRILDLSLSYMHLRERILNPQISPLNLSYLLELSNVLAVVLKAMLSALPS